MPDENAAHARRVPQRYRVLQLAVDQPDGFTRGHAAYDLGVFELASRIGELEAEGVEFDRTTSTGRNRYGDRIHWTTYRLRYCPPSLRAHIEWRLGHE